MALTPFIADTLHTCHAFLAGLSGQELWAIEKDEADKLGGAITNVTRHYDIPGLEQKTIDWVRLFQVAGMIYGTRLLAAAAMRKPKTPQTQQPASNQAQQMTAPPPPNIVRKPAYPGGPMVDIAIQ